ncbi:MAG: cytochrome c biogenesis protein CcsA [Desulfovibrio sp.]|jgi:cytochrome c-type biogenesis protein CcmF|nr:cytochrome c biogenesis protein CcsA [Desulfovibrio sp.]
MYVFASTIQLLTLLCALSGGGLALYDIWRGRGDMLPLVEKLHWFIAAALLLASAILLHALYRHDFELKYVASYTDLILPVFYRLTAFWAGQEGSMLFWALSVALGGTIFAVTGACKALTPATRLWYWVFFYAIVAFFTLILTTWSNPFTMLTPPPKDGNGLNPLLQNPGMIFHPPLLFLGYGGFVVPSCLALAQTLSGKRNEETAWFRLTRPFLILAWLALTAGIVLGAWWAYMELGWGGYWAWDPVENASLLPWLISTAALHTLIIEERCRKLGRVNVVMIALTTVSAFFATYLVRSGVVESVHAFGDGSVGTPLTIFVLAGLFVAFWTVFWSKAEGRFLAGPGSREGLLTLLAWVLLALAVIILAATLWPQISKFWTSVPKGMDAAFYNRICLPLGAIVVVMMAFCPWLRMAGGLNRKNAFMGLIACMLISAAALWMAGYRQSTALVAAAAAFGLVYDAVLMLKNTAVFRSPSTLGALGAHLGMALVTVGIAFSGPYAEDKDMTLAQGQSGQIQDYSATLLDIRSGRRPGYEYVGARIEVRKGDKRLGIIEPERRVYDKFGTMQFSEVDTIPRPGDEIYASLLRFDGEKRVLVKISVKPFVNWLWIGGAMLCILPLLCLRRRKSGSPASGAAGTKSARLR